MKWITSIFLGIILSSALGQEPELKNLENALWKGTLDISIQGSLQNHFLANKMTAMGSPEGFTQEKAKMAIDFTLKIQFLINPLGETTFLAAEHFDGVMTRDMEIKYRIEEERVMEGDIRVPDYVQIFESKESTVEFFRNQTYDQDSFDKGEFAIRPSGRMEKRGELEIQGSMNFIYSGEGSYVFQKERQPPSEEYARLQEKANLSQIFHLPVNFHTKIKHKTKPVEGTLVFEKSMENPFTHEESEGYKKDLFTNSLVYTGTLKIEPLMTKK